MNRREKTCGTRMMASDPNHINYYKYFLRNGTSHWAKDPKLYEWALTMPRYARYILNHPDKQKQKTQGVFGAFEQRVLPNAYRTQTMEYQQSKEQGGLTDYLEGIPTTSVLEAPDVKTAFARIEASVPFGDPRREQTINELKKKYIRERTVRNPIKDDMGRILEQGRTRGLEEASQRESRDELRRLINVFRGSLGLGRGKSLPQPLLSRMAELLGLETLGNRTLLTERILRARPDLGVSVRQEESADRGDASYVSRAESGSAPTPEERLRIAFRRGSPEEEQPQSLTFR